MRLQADVRPSLAGVAADRIRDAILGHYFVAGDRLGIEDLADRVGVSTMPVREALIVLEREGLVQRLPRRGFRVASVKADDIEDIFLVHAFLAGTLASRAAQVASDSLIVRLSAIHDQTLAAAKTTNASARASKIEKLNHEFHRAINRSVNAPRLRWFLRTTTRYVPGSFYRSIPGWIDTTLEDHPAIIEALRAHDALTSRSLLEAHVRRGGRLVVDAFRDGDPPSVVADFDGLDRHQ